MISAAFEACFLCTSLFNDSHIFVQTAIRFGVGISFMSTELFMNDLLIWESLW